MAFQRLLVPLDGSASAEQALPMAEIICRKYQASLTLVSVLQAQDRLRFLPTTQARLRRMAEASRAEREAYLSQIARQAYANGKGVEVDYAVGVGPIAEEINTMACEVGVDLVVMSTHGCADADHKLIGSVANKIVRLVNKPVLLVRPASNGNGKAPQLKKLLLALDGSEFAERMLPYAKALATRFDSEILLLSVPEVPETWKYGAMAEAVEGLRAEAEAEICQYLESIATAFREEGLKVRAMVTGSGPARTIVAVSESEAVDLIMLATHGRGGLDRLFMGSVADRVVQQTRRPVFLVPVQERRTSSREVIPQPAQRLR